MRKTRPALSYKRIAFVASDGLAAQRARRRLVQRYGDVRPETADVVVALGGDGLMLATLQRFMNSGKPIYGMHRGTVGFLMNEYSERDLHAWADCIAAQPLERAWVYFKHEDAGRGPALARFRWKLNS